jgi:hypothetical protein
MNTLSIVGLGKVAIHNCCSEDDARDLISSFIGSHVSVLLPCAYTYVRSKNQPVELSGALLMPNGDVIDLYSGGALDNIEEVIISSLVIQSPEYTPSDFSLS